MSEGLVKDPLAAYGLREGQQRYINSRSISIEDIQRELMEEPCELCGQKTGEVGQLFAKDGKDEMGRHIVQMVCAKCLTKNRKQKIKVCA
jgi:hypothetical protein